ncbi:sucrase ferredoxin [Longimycelium tulufanense]|uniref:Sucrase ferredoxin n=1 Tax=Longimycelium tulufanense TaxID=907463 RepID=A0A8J3CEA9_9PSEU|nr:sucrase ferredoxin [Longimycelium tulufanense]GGM82223.1 sucrase ferredoxin [Longimycelium tulufanense]
MGRPVLSTANCAVLSAELGEPLAGTAPVAQAWLCLEQPGPWGHNALRESHLDPGLGAELERRTEGTGVRVALIRRPGRHADIHLPRPRQVYLACTRPGATWMEGTQIEDPQDLLDLDFHALAVGRRPYLGEPCAEPLLMVCTNGRRDRCCALLGRPVATAAAARHPEQVWESTHTGGHRLAPTAVLLPTGYVYGRLAISLAERLLTEHQVIARGCRGRSTWSPSGQVAELAVRERIVEWEPDAMRAVATDDGLVRVEHTDGRAWQVTAEERPVLPPRPVSCGKPPSTPTAWYASRIARLR